MKTADLERLLQSRFGTEQQTASYQAKLCARRREANEPLQGVSFCHSTPADFVRLQRRRPRLVLVVPARPIAVRLLP